MREGIMSGSIPSWVTNIESDKTNYQKKVYFTLILNIVMLIAFLYITTRFGDNLLLVILSALIVSILIISVNDKTAAQKPNRPNLLAANLYRIGTELENFDPSSPSFLKNNRQYFKNCENILIYLMAQKSYFIEDYDTFLNNIDDIIIRMDLFYSNKLKPTNGSISSNLIKLAEEIHDNHANLLPTHTAYVNAILSDLEEIPQPLNTSSLNKWGKSFNTGWHNLQEPYRKVVTYLVIFITIFSVSSLVMFYLGVEKTNSIGYAFLGTSTLVGFSIKLN